MKRFSFFIFSACLSSIMFAISTRAQHLQVSGRFLQLDGKPLILRGINYPIIDDGAIDLSKPSDYKTAIDEASKTGANCIRLAWYEPNTHWRDASAPGTVSGYVGNGHLNNMIAYCISKQMIPVLELHNITCSDNWKSFRNAIADFWSDPDILALIHDNKSRLIINLANEFGKVQWAGGVADRDTFRENYKRAIDTLRKLGVEVPIMIDAPDCGQSSSDLKAVAADLDAADPLHNLIFSAHTYWAYYAGTKSAAEAKLAEMLGSGFCWVLGEVSNKQDNAACADTDLNTLYPEILKSACINQIGWLAWVFNQDCSALRDMSTDGTFSHLTSFGNDIVNNTTYGLKAGISCSAVPLSLEYTPTMSHSVFLIFPNPIRAAEMKVKVGEPGLLRICDLNGHLLLSVLLLSGINIIDVRMLQEGTFLAKFGDHYCKFSKE